MFPEHNLVADDIISTWSGVRPVIGSDKRDDPSKERRDHAVWMDKGLVTVSGGKLTTFRLIALDAINAAAATLGSLVGEREQRCHFQAPRVLAPDELNIPNKQWAQRLIGRYGAACQKLYWNKRVKRDENHRRVRQFCLAECRWAARNESVLHLDDLLLRRTRLGSVLERGGEAMFSAMEENLRPGIALG